ncbi:Protein of unknown function [Lactobacillus delbrueckii subsp. bulgaricus]|nr:Protein of unknown function [Lactobacillus delbrueckii subsp. bulgaricus]
MGKKTILRALDIFFQRPFG